MSLPAGVLDRLVFSVGERDYRWSDVVAAGRAWGRWTALERTTASSLASLRRLEEPISQAELDRAEQEFRYARSLLAADEMEDWLRHWQLTTEDWVAYLRRQLARGDESAEDGSPTEREVWAEAVCSGALAQLARELAARAAAVEAEGGEPGDVESDLPAMDAALARLGEQSLTPEARAKMLELRTADWVRLDYSALAFTRLAMAREAALCLREDGLTLSEVAERAGIQVRRGESLAAALDPELSKPLLSAPPGEVVGPVESNEEFVLMQVHGKIAPTLRDPVIQDLLQTEVPRRALEREVRNRVRWHERL